MRKFLFLLICFVPTAFAKEKIVITGSSTIAPVISDIAKAYEELHKGVRIDVQTGGSSRGIADARKGIADIGMVSRSLKATEQDLHGFAIAKDGLAIVVHKDNPIRELSAEQIVKIYKGEIKNWKQLGGDDKSIVVINKAEGRSTLELFLKFFSLKNSQIKADIIIGDNEQGIKSISRNPYAIGYVSVGTAEYNQSVGTSIKSLPMNGVEAKVANVENGTYPLARKLNIVTKQKPAGLVKKFIEFAYSVHAKKLVKEHYFVPTNSTK